MATPSTSSSLEGSKPRLRVTANAGWPVRVLPALATDGRNGRFGGLSQRSNHCSVRESTRAVSWLPPSWPPANQTMSTGAPLRLMAW